jgi:hypothetical protein
MSNLEHVKPDMDVIGADGAHLGTVAAVEDGRIKLAKSGDGSHGDHHHYLSGGLVAEVEGDTVRLSATAANALFFEEEKSGQGLEDKQD